MRKLTETEGVILAELIFKLAGGDEGTANRIADFINDALNQECVFEPYLVFCFSF